MSSIVGARELRIELLRQSGPPPRGIGRAASGNDGGAPPTENGSISVLQRALIQRLGANPTLSNPGAQGAASTTHSGKIDVRV